MSATENNVDPHGGPAFPVVCQDVSKHQVVEAGMSLRDYFAAFAMHALLIDAMPGLRHARDGARERLAQISASTAYMMADAILAEREKKEVTPDDSLSLSGTP